jgi:hypothetical protein
MKILTCVHRGNNLSRLYHIFGGSPVRAGTVGVGAETGFLPSTLVITRQYHSTNASSSFICT